MTLNIKWKSTTGSFLTYTKKLEKLGLMCIGYGSYSEVFYDRSDSGKVVKVFRLSNNANSLQWLKWCYDNPSKYVPKIFDIQGFKSEGGSFVRADLERLNIVKPDAAFLAKWCKRHNLIDCVAPGDTPGAQNLYFSEHNLVECAAKFPELHKVIKAILSITKHQVNQDMTPSNLVVIKNDLLFLDPVCGGSYVGQLNPVMADLINDLEEMPVAKLKTLGMAMVGINYFVLDYGFDQFKGDMKVNAAHTRQLPTPTQERLMLGMNAMRWLTKFYLKEVVQGFSTVYRLHASDVTDLPVGKEYTFRPRKPILSWTTLKDPYVADRDIDPNLRDYVLSSKPKRADIVWSYRVRSWLPEIREARDWYDDYMRSGSSAGVDKDVKDAVSIILDELYNAVDIMLEKEQEVIIYQGTEPFKATVVKQVANKYADDAHLSKYKTKMKLLGLGSKSKPKPKTGTATGTKKVDINPFNSPKLKGYNPKLKANHEKVKF